VAIADRPATANPGRAGSVLRQRLLTAAVLLPVVVAGMFFLPNLLWGLILLVPTALGAIEWSRLSGFSPAVRNALLGGVVATGLLLLLVQWRLPAQAVNFAAWLFLLALLFWALLVPAWLYFRWRVASRPAMFLAGWTLLIPAWLAMTQLQRSPALLLMLLAVVWIADSAAYFTGRRFGRRKLAPEISPGKTWEGVIGAAVAVLAYGFAVGFVLQPEASLYDRAGLLVFIAVLTAFSIIGDLFESWIKRQAGAKDSGGLLPGHGGVLDRIDSLTAAMPFAALYFLHSA
jgi:phosphatidate cytidylyltransferase